MVRSDEERGKPPSPPANNGKEVTAQVGTKPPSLVTILKMIRPEWPVLFVCLILMVVAETMGLIIPIVTARAYDALVQDDATDSDRMSEINSTMSLVMVMHLFGVSAGFGKDALLGVIGERFVARLRNAVYKSLMSQEIA